MNRNPYSSYHGRKGRGRSVLIAIIIVLVLVLTLAIAGLFILPNYMVYTADGPQLVLPFFTPRESHAPTAAPATAAPPATDEPVIIIDAPSATPAPTPAPAADLSAYTPRSIPLGLVLVTPESLDKAGSNGALVDMTGVEPGSLSQDFSDKLAALPYAAAWVSDVDDLAAHCQALAALGFDELVFAPTAPSGSGADLAAAYRSAKKALSGAGWQGRLGLVLDQGLFDRKYDADLIPAVAQSFDRLYFKTTLKAENKDALTKNGFKATGYTIVTAVKQAASLNYAWAILPE